MFLIFLSLLLNSKKQTLNNRRTIRIIIAFLFLSYHMSSQVMISDSAFLQALIEYGVDTNQDGQIQFDEAEAITILEIGGKDIYSIKGIEAFTNLTKVHIRGTFIDSADFTNNLLLRDIHLGENELTNIQMPSLPQLNKLVLRNNELPNVDMNNFPNLEVMDLDNNNLSSIDLSNLAKLEELKLRDNFLTSLDISELPNLLKIDVSGNILDSLDFSENLKLRNLCLSHNNFTSIDVKHLKDLLVLVLHKCRIKTLDIAGLDNLFTLWVTDSSVRTIFMKGTSPDQSQFKLAGAPLKYICANQSYIPIITNKLDNANITDCLVTSFCPTTDEGVFGGISGRVKIGQSIADCDTTTNNLAYPKFETEYLDMNGQHFGALIGRQDGSYDINFYGTMTLRPAMTYANEWQHLLGDFTAQNYSSNPQYFVQDFCILPVSDILRTEMNIIPQQEFRAGFETNLILRVKNTGTLPFSGSLKLNLPQDSLTYISSDYIPSLIEPTSIHWDIQDLLPFNEIKIKTTLRLNSPMDEPPLFGGEDIQLCAELTHAAQYQNNICINDFSVNSFDPNDKTYMGKDSLTIEQFEDLDQLTYLIRFENTGSAEAINIAITDQMDDTFIDPNSIRILDASHDVSLEQLGDGAANFIFRNINLPFEPGFNRGYVLFSVKPKAGNISINDQLKNSAAIYFDFNFPIITNDASLWIVDNTSSSSTPIKEDFNTIKIFPNPSTGKFTIELEEDQNIIEKIEWINSSGKLLKTDNINSKNFQFNETGLVAGIYSLRITTAKYVQIQKVIIQGN